MKTCAPAYLAAAASVSFLLLAQSASAASTDEIRAKAYFNAIAGGNAETITSFYADKAEFHWVGGPLAGVYKGKAQIKAVWRKFGQSAGDIKHKILEISESHNGKISTVTARVNFIGPRQVPVKFILMYQDGKITSEIWQVDKEPQTYAKAAPAPNAVVETPPVDQPAEAAAPPDESAGKEPSAVIATITATPDAAASAAGEPTTSAAAPPPEKRVAPKKLAHVKKPQKKPIRRDYDDDDDDDYAYWAPRRYYYGNRPYYGYGYGYGYGRYDPGYGYRRYGPGGY